MLREWASASAASRRWDKLRELSGAARLELAERLAARLLSLGVWSQREQFLRSAWRLVEITWTDLAALQRELGLATVQDRAAAQSALNARLEAMLDEELVGEAAAHLMEASLSAKIKTARAELLEGLLRWSSEQREGLRQDFALLARPHTKAVAPGEWAWLEQGFDLAAVGIGRFLPQVWLAGDGRMVWPEGAVDLRPLPFVGLPAPAFASLSAVHAAPQRYWLIENRASFERQAAKREPGHCLVWTAGRPSLRWLSAMEHLLELAPAPAWVSADADPAGVEIALAASEPWRKAGLPWEPWRMDAALVQGAKRLPLNAYDRSCMARLEQDLGKLPPVLQELLEEMRLRGKAEQEGWL